MTRRTFPLFLALAWALACGASGGLRGDVYKGDGLAFRLGPIPPSWRQLEVKGARVAFRDEAAESTVLVNARCGKDGDDVPLQALTQHLFMSFTARETIDQKVVPMDGREAMHTMMNAKLDGVPLSFDTFVLKKDGCVYDFVDISAPAKFAANRVVFETFVGGFHTQNGEP
jgi:hypothetical protein